MNLQAPDSPTGGVRFLVDGEMTEEFARLTPEEHAMLDAVNSRVAARESLENLLSFLLEQTTNFSPCDRLGLAFFEEEGRRAVAGAVVARYEPLVLRSGYTQNMSGSSLEPILQTGAVRIIDDLEAYLHTKPQSISTQLLVREGVRSNMTCPLRVDGRIVGVLFRSARRPRAYDRHHAALHARIAERLSQAVEKVRLIEQLQTANRAYLDMLGFVSHELKSPLSAIITSGDMLSQGFMGELTPEQKEWMGRMTTQAHYLMSLIRDYLDLARLEGGQMKLRLQPGVRLKEDILAPAQELLRLELDKQHVRLEQDLPSTLSPLTCDPDLMKIVAINLLGNAIKYGQEPGEVRVTAREDDTGVAWSVWNRGPGFTEEDQHRLFKKFSRLPSPELHRRKGSGLGLYTCWRIVQLHHGLITARSTPGHWAEFTVRLPLHTAPDEK